MSIAQRVKNFFIGISLVSSHKPLLEDSPSHVVSSDAGESETTADGVLLVRVRETLRQKGYSEAAFAINRFDACFIRTGHIHPILQERVVPENEKTESFS